MKKNFPFPKQTHFAGILLPDEIESALEERRSFMRANFGCKSGQSTPIHITLVPPFALKSEFSTRDLTEAVQNAIENFSGDLPIRAKIQGFSAFSQRTIFASVENDENLKEFRKNIFVYIAENFASIKKSEFLPHITIANRDIPQEFFDNALAKLRKVDFSADFLIDNVAVFTKENGIWKACEKNIVRIKS